MNSCDLNGVQALALHLLMPAPLLGRDGGLSSFFLDPESLHVEYAASPFLLRMDITIYPFDVIISLIVSDHDLDGRTLLFS